MLILYLKIFKLNKQFPFILTIHVNIKYFQYPPKKFDDYDVDIKINCCGVCGSDVHTVINDWGKKSNLPLGE